MKNVSSSRQSWRFGISAIVALVVAVQPIASIAADCAVLKEDNFAREGVRLVQGHGTQTSSAFGIYKARLRVNTDGAPNSYHPGDPRGERIAINRIDNGVTIRRQGGAKLTAGTGYFEAFDEWKKAKFPARLPGYVISWENVIAATPEGTPCIFKEDENEGYFGSLTALRNGLQTDASGECAFGDQLDQRYIPAIALRGNSNPLREYGARTGDLVVAINPATGVVVPAVIGDTGDGDAIGEGSVALNMALLGTSRQPKTYGDALALDTNDKQMIVAVLPNTRAFERMKPYSSENIHQRVSAWVAQQGYGSLENFADLAETCAQGL